MESVELEPAPVASPAPVAPPASDRAATTRLVAKNTLWLAGGQIIGMPLGILTSALLARWLGAEDYGFFFLVTTMAGFAATFSEFGQGGAAQRAVARDRSAAGTLLTSALALRLGSFVVAHIVLAVAYWVLDYPSHVGIALAIVTGQTLLFQFGQTAALAARAYERSEFVARNTLILQFATLVAIVPALLLGGGLVGVMVAQLVAAAVASWIDWRLLARLGIQLRRARVATMRLLAREGVGFLVLGGVVVLQWNVNAVMLSKLAGAEVMGWYAAAQRLVGFLIFPCSAVIGSLYPTLCRLVAEDPEEAAATTRSALGVMSWVVLPVALGCALFPDIGIQIFSRESFEPAEDNLRISALVIFFLYFVMVLATYVNALGLQRVWALLQLGSVAISSALNVLLIPMFQDSMGNGGLGVVTATVVSEGFLVFAALRLAPTRLLNASFFRSFGLALLAAACMAIVGLVLRPLVTSWVAAPIAVVVYVVCLRVTGVLNPATIAMVRDMVRRRKARA